MAQKAARGVQLAAVAALLLAADPATVMAQVGEITLRADLEYQFSDVESKDKATDEKTQSDYSRFKQKYDVDLRQELLPFLEFRSGGLFELIDISTTTGDEDADREEKTRRVYAELNLNNPLYTAGTSYIRQTFDVNLDGIPNRERNREEFRGLLNWRPVGFPTIDLDVDNTRIWDDDDTVDQTVDRILLKSRYDYRDFAYDYSYTRNDTDKKIEDAGSLSQIHNVGLYYSTDFFDDQLELASSARLNYEDLKPRGNEIVERPVTSFGTEFFYRIDEDPDELEFVPPALLTEINIGQGGGLNPVSVGLAFEFPTEVNKVHIILDADVNVVDAVADDYVWTVSWTDDTDLSTAIWNPFTGVDVKATYNDIENRFEIQFPRVDGARAIKVATYPQVDAVEPIRTRQIRAFTTLDVDPGEKIEDFEQNYNLGLRWIISDKTETSYQGYFRYQDSKPFDVTKKTFTNSISLRHDFNPKLVGNAKILRTDTTETARQDLTYHSYTASLRADYLETLRQTLIYSGFHEDLGNLTSYSNSILLRTNADLYEGWSSNLDLGFIAKHLTEGDDATTANFRISTNVDPNPKLRFVIDYRFSRNTQSGIPSWLDQYARFQGFWLPLRTLSFFGAVNLRHNERNDRGLEVFQNYSVNWAPFPDGSLRFSLGYNLVVDTRNNMTSALSPRIDWQLTRTTLLTVLSNLGSTESDQVERDVKSVLLTFRTYY